MQSSSRMAIGSLARVPVRRIRHGSSVCSGSWRSRQVAGLGQRRSNARWSKDGKELYYFDPTYSLFAVPVNAAGSAVQLGTPQTLVRFADHARVIAWWLGRAIHFDRALTSL
jgi:hypothetical protein